MKNAVGRRINPLAAECVGALLKECYRDCDPWAPVLSPIPIIRIRSNLKDLKHLEQYLRIMGN